jgi:hypothetical protein
MKRILFFLFGIALTSVFLTSCNEEVDLIGDFEETAVIYGLLDQADSIHFVKITRAFIGPGNALDIAQIPDSSYFNQVDATVSEYLKDGQGNYTIKSREWVLKDTIVTNKETNGVFYAPTQKLYYFTTRKCKFDGSQQTNSASTADLLNSLNKDAKYKFNANINDGLFEVEATTELIYGISSSADPQSFRLDLVENPGEYVQDNIQVQTGNSYVLNTTMKVNYHEIEMGVDTTARSFSWNLGEYDVTPMSSKSFLIGGELFFKKMKASVSSNPLIDQRRLYSVTVTCTGGSDDLYKYMLVNQPSSSLAQNKPTFTNLSATNNHKVIGIFTSRYTHSVEKFYINPSNNNLRMFALKSVIELCTGAITGDLYFCSQHVGEIGTSYHCP